MSMALPQGYIVNSQAAMTALAYADINDLCYRTDLGVTFILQGVPASTVGNWIQVAPSTGGGGTSLRFSAQPETVTISSTTGTLSQTPNGLFF